MERPPEVEDGRNQLLDHRANKLQTSSRREGGCGYQGSAGGRGQAEMVTGDGRGEGEVVTGDGIGEGEMVTGDGRGQAEMVTGDGRGQGEMVTGDGRGQAEMVTGDGIGEGEMVTGDGIGEGEMVTGDGRGEGEMVTGDGRGHELPHCIICKDSKGGLKRFNEQCWEKMKTTAEIRLLQQSDRFRQTTVEVNLLTMIPCYTRYHSQCYKNYTAVHVKKSKSTEVADESRKVETRRRSSLTPSNERGLLKGSCIFCPVVRKTIRGKVEQLTDCLTKDGCEAIRKVAHLSKNERIKALVAEGVDLIAKEAQYHKSCRRQYFQRVEEAGSKETPEVSSRQLHAESFSSLASLVEQEIILKHKAMFLTDILDLYKREYVGAGGSEEDIGNYTGQALMNKIKDKFRDKISISKYDNRKGNFLHSPDVSDTDARASLFSHDGKHAIRTAALQMRAAIQAMPKWSTPTPTSVENLKLCSPDLPDEIMLFYRTLLCGIRQPSGDENREILERKACSMASDAVYNASRGLVRPWKHTVLGLGLGTLTGSKLVLQILNRLGYSLSYDEVKILETEFAFSIEETSNEAPDGVQLHPNLGTGLAWDNYDVNMETLDGKDTLHATVGICYQNREENHESQRAVPVENLNFNRTQRKRRRFDGTERDIPPYHKSLKKAKFHLSAPSVATEQGAEPRRVATLRAIDFHWLLMSEVEKPLPLFPGYYSQFIKDPLPRQKIWYMEPISAPPTRNDVVKETMNRTMNLAAATGQEYGIVTYDLAVALKAYSIQAMDSPHFDKLLIMLGNFHLELALYGAVGTFINQSGIEHLLTETGILAEGSLMGFVRGKFYNRCSRIHQIIALVMERKLYERFKSTLPLETQKAVDDLLTDADADQEDIRSQEMFSQHMDQYEKFFEGSINGELGPTAQFWTIYIYMINRVHRNLMRALRTNNVSEYIEILPDVIDIFFGLNRPNYARWGVLFLRKLEEATPGCKTVLDAGAFSIRRTHKNFARSAIDLTLEQTVNRDAASPMKGIVNFQNSMNAMRRWCINSTQRGMVVTELRILTGLETVEQPAVQLRESRVAKDSQQRDALYKAVEDSCDPFSEPAVDSTCLLNLATGKAAAEKTKAYLITTIEEGHRMHTEFKQQCAEDPQRFLKKNARRQVNNFAKENVKQKPTATASSKRKSAESLRDIFIRTLVAISKQTNFDLKHYMSFPIIDYPLAISHENGFLLKTDKSKLLQKLEEYQSGFEDKPLPQISVTLIDGGLLIHSQLSAMGTISTYGHLAKSLLSSVCSHPGNEVHVLFDTYKFMSLKESERRQRGAEDHPFVISGPEQGPRQRCGKLLQNGNFKDQLGRFLLDEWQKDFYGPIIQRKKVVVSYGGSCISLQFLNNKMHVNHPMELQGTHEEADTLLAFHLTKVQGNAIIRASDTDVMVIAIGILAKIQTPQRQVLMDCGSGNTRRFIDLTAITDYLENKQPGLALALPTLHAFTGCDYSAAFYMKGKIKPLKVLESSSRFTKFFKDMPNTREPDQQIAEEFICEMYAMKVKTVNEARYEKLCQMTGKLGKDNPMTNIKRVDCALLPPCSAAVTEKLKRAHLIGTTWARADSPQPGNGLDPLSFGWKERNHCYVPILFSGRAIPDHIFENNESDEEAMDNTSIDDGSIIHDEDSETESDEDGDEQPWSEDDSDQE